MKIDQPKIRQDIESVDLNDWQLDDELELECSLIVDAVLENKLVTRAQLSEVLFRNCRFNGTDFEKISMIDVQFENCDLSNCNMNKASIHRTVFKNCKLLGVDLSESRFGNVQFIDSVMNLANFSESKLEKTLFQDSRIQGVDFYSCKFKDLEFKKCDIDESTFDQTPLKGIDISTSTFNTLSVPIENLRGCKVSSYQALRFATLLGLIIQD